MPDSHEEVGPLLSVSINCFNSSQFSFIDALFIRRVMSSANAMTHPDTYDDDDDDDDDDDGDFFKFISAQP